MRFFLTIAVFITGITCAKAQDDIAQTVEVAPQHAIALHGTPKYPSDFDHLDFVNPNAPKGGTLRLSATGTFDSLNPFIVKGDAAAGFSANYMRSGMIYESLMQNAWDEPFTLYGILAKNITVAPDKSWVRFVLRDEAKWNDGVPITADDVVWTFNTLTTQGKPFFKAYWHDVKEVKALDDKTVEFTFSVAGNAELPLIIAEMTILPKHYWTAEGRIFNETSLVPPLSSGPYKVGKIDAGRSIEFIRNDNWWGADLPFFKGMYNFDRIVYDYYRDDNVAHEAFLAKDYDVKIENIAKVWFESYTVPAEKKKDLIMEEIENKRPAGLQGYIYNIRRPLFQDVRVREALGLAFDFEWANKQFAHGTYVRTDSYFENSDLASSGLPSDAELEILEPFRTKIPNEVFTSEFKVPVTSGDGNIRKNLRAAVKLLSEAGYKKLDQDGIRYKENIDGTRQKLKFEILYYSGTFERWVLPFIKNLQRIGVKAEFRIVDSAQFQRRMNTFDYDVVIGGFGQSESPGNEQREYWGSDRANIEGSRNYIGIQDPIVDEIVTQIIHADTREDLVTKTRALDRILLWNHYVIPMWHYPKWRIAYWNSIQRPKNLSGISPLITQTWWAKAPPKQAE